MGKGREKLKPPLNKPAKTEKVKTAKNRKRKKVEEKDISGMMEMRRLMEKWTVKKGRKRTREEDDEDVETLPVAVNVEKPVTVVENVELSDSLVARVKSKFDNPGKDLDPNRDFDS